jgi:hypothetical protein
VGDVADRATPGDLGNRWFACEDRVSFDFSGCFVYAFPVKDERLCLGRPLKKAHLRRCTHPPAFAGAGFVTAADEKSCLIPQDFVRLASGPF